MANELILLVAYQFPPCGGAGVQRVVQLCKYFPENGIDPLVLTTNESTYLKENRKLDESLNSFIPSDQKKIEISNPFPFKLKDVLLKLKLYPILWYVFYPILWEVEFSWAIRVCFSLRKIFNEYQNSIVLTTSGPFSSILIGLVAAKIFGKKWICDLRDPFTDAYAWNFPSMLHNRAIRRVELWSISKAMKVVVTSEATKNRYAELGISAEKIMVITNGYS